MHSCSELNIKTCVPARDVTAARVLMLVTGNGVRYFQSQVHFIHIIGTGTECFPSSLLAIDWILT